MEAAYEISQEHHKYPNLTVCDQYYDGAHTGWRVRPNEGYVMYDSADQTEEPLLGEDGSPVMDEKGEMIMVPVTYYFTESLLPLTFPWQNFTWVAVPRDSVDENYIFGT